MWDEQKRQRFQELNQDGRELTAAEQVELAQLEREIEALEANYLGPATERLRVECEVIEAQNRALEAIAARKEALANRLHKVLQEAKAERLAIDGELTALLAGSQGSKTGP